MALRMTVQTQLILQALLRDPARELYGLELAEETGPHPRRSQRAGPAPWAGRTRLTGGSPAGRAE